MSVSVLICILVGEFPYYHVSYPGKDIITLEKNLEEFKVGFHFFSWHIIADRKNYMCFFTSSVSLQVFTYTPSFIMVYGMLKIYGETRINIHNIVLVQ